MPIRYLNRRRTIGTTSRRRGRTVRRRGGYRPKARGRRVFRRRGGMTRKSIINMTSRKKRDTMLTITNITATSQQAGTTYFPNPAVITGGTNASPPIVWCATARDATYQGTNPGTVFTDATRTATECYMRGLSENIEIQVSDGVPWQWRRICFTYKGFNNAAPDIAGFSLYYKSSVGAYARAMNMVPNNTYKDTIEGLIFKGVANSDWNDPIIAPLDKTRITVKYDRTRTIASGNEDGCIRKYKLYHPMNKTLVYGDDEQGGNKTMSFYSVQSKRGMGDYIVIDYFRPRQGSASSNQLSFSSNATLYWHEK